MLTKVTHKQVRGLLLLTGLDRVGARFSEARLKRLAAAASLQWEPLAAWLEDIGCVRHEEDVLRLPREGEHQRLVQPVKGA